MSKAEDCTYTSKRSDPKNYKQPEATRQCERRAEPAHSELPPTGKVSSRLPQTVCDVHSFTGLQVVVSNCL